jgi:pheromone shutdown-related protein TraB
MNEMSNVYKISLEDKEVILIGTAHVSQQSADDVEAVVRKENPDAIGVELDNKRYKVLSSSKPKKDYSMEEIWNLLLDGKLFEFIFTNIMSLPQNRLADRFNIKPGAEMIKGIDIAKEMNKELLLLDRDINVTISRLVNSIPIWIMPILGISAIFSLVTLELITPEDIEKLRSEEGLEQAMNMVSQYLPGFTRSLIDERDKIISYNILNSQAYKIVAILGAGHIKGVMNYLKKGITEEEIKDLNKEEKFDPLKNMFQF